MTLLTRTPIVLASTSPRRQELLRNAGIEFIVRPADIPEIPVYGESPQVFAERMAAEKAKAIAATMPGALILGADTVVAVDAEILGKPENAADAARMLRLLRDRAHYVITAVCLLGEDFQDVRSETTAVHFTTMSDAEIEDYVASGEPMDKAGAYAIQGRASRWISRIEGDYYNVVGLPVDLVWRMLREHGVS
jgi:nucleoside triphosphate pyrophosphatase